MILNIKFYTVTIIALLFINQNTAIAAGMLVNATATNKTSIEKTSNIKAETDTVVKIDSSSQKISSSNTKDNNNINKETFAKVENKKEEPVKIDPCEAYKVSYEAYVVCQDRVMKIKRMMDANKRRRQMIKK